MNKAQADCLIDRSALEAAFDNLAGELNTALGTQQPVLVLTVLQGGLIFAGQLLPRLEFELEQDYVHATRYHGAQSGSELRWIAKPTTDLKNRHVLLLDDIYDEGTTLQSIVRFCRRAGAASVKCAVMLKKNHDRSTAELKPDFVALQVEDHYVFGFGMDLDHKWRNANGIYAMTKE